MDDYQDYDPYASNPPSRQEQVKIELAAKYKCESYCFSFNYKQEEIIEPILHSEYFEGLQETLYFYRNSLS